MAATTPSRRYSPPLVTVRTKPQLYTTVSRGINVSAAIISIFLVTLLHMNPTITFLRMPYGHDYLWFLLSTHIL